MHQYEVSFFVTITVDAEDIGTATNDTDIEVRVTEMPACQTRVPGIEIDWDRTARFDHDTGEAIEEWGADGVDFGPEDDDD